MKTSKYSGLKYKHSTKFHPGPCSNCGEPLSLVFQRWQPNGHDACDLKLFARECPECSHYTKFYVHDHMIVHRECVTYAQFMFGDLQAEHHVGFIRPEGHNDEIPF